ncbi:MAG: DegT/DnrJ/EryC1/StrS family aminotransferase, partial [Acidimicrobiia bacterium]
MTSQIPLVDLDRQTKQIRTDVEAGWTGVLERSGFILGSEVSEFEASFARFCEAQFCIGVANGTDAIELALRAAGIGRGDEVLIPANTFIATALAVLRAGADVRLVDCDPDYYLMDQGEAVARLDRKTRAIVPVHLFGQIAPCDNLLTVPDLIVIEDAAQAQGATRHGRRIGSFGIAAATSFYPGKNIGAFGDAGAIVTNDAEIARKVSALRNWGSSEKYHHPEIGFNSRLDTLQAVV